MNDKMDILRKIKGKKFVLLNLKLENLFESRKKEEVEISQISKYKYTILENTEELLRIKFNAHLYFEPQAIYDINLDYELEFRLKEPIKESDFRKHISVILSPLANEISYLTAFLTDRMMDQPLIIAPIIDEDNLDWYLKIKN